MHKHEEPRSKFWIWCASIWKSAIATLGGAAALLALFVLYPWLSLELGDRLNDKDPFGIIMNASDEGYLPLTDVSVMCYIDLETTSGNVFKNGATGYDHIAKSLSYKHKLSLPCGIKVNTGIKKVDLRVLVSYNIWFIPGRRTQDFFLVGVIDSEQNWHWLFKN
jgi:hypothetical protein